MYHGVLRLAGLRLPEGSCSPAWTVRLVGQFKLAFDPIVGDVYEIASG